MPFITALVALLCFAIPLHAQSTASVHGRVFDESGGLIVGATVTVSNPLTGFDESASTDDGGRFHVAAVPAGSYRITVAAGNFRSEVIEAVTFEVGRVLVRDFRMAAGNRTETVLVSAELLLLDRASATVGHVVTAETVREVPLNGRHFTDLGLLVPGSVAPSQTGFSTTPTRGVGALAINTTGNREEAVAFLVNGVSTNNLTFGSLMFQPPLGSIREFRVDNSAFSAEFGHVSGAIVNIVTRSGSDQFHGEAFGFYRNEALDARNFFEFNSAEPHPFERNQFGGALGGPILPGRTFFFSTYEGLRQKQGLDVNSLVLSDEQRAAAADPAIRRLIDLIPRANYVDVGGTPRFVGAAAATADNDRWTLDLRHNLGAADRLHVFFGHQAINAVEPTSNGHTIPGFGHLLLRSVGALTIGETHTFGSSVLNEARFGRSYGFGTANPRAVLNPAEFGIDNGISRALALPQIAVAGGLVFGGPATYPTGRDDTSYVFSDTLSYFAGNHALKIGGEYRHFLNENFEEGAGAFNFPSVPAFLSGNANSFSVILGERRSHIDARALAAFAQDSIQLRSNLTLELGLRYEWHVTPTERDNQFVVFDQATARLLRVGVDLDEIHRQNNTNFEPRAGIAWTSPSGRTVVRGAHAWAVDQPSTTAVRNTAANPPFAIPLTASGSIPIGNALAATATAGIAPATIDRGFRNASLRSWNANIQQQLAGRLAMTVGYFGSHGTNLRISRNLNQPVDGVRPFTTVAASSPILPGTALGNITQVEGTGFSNYNAVWLSVTRRLSRGLQFDGSYTWSKSLDTNSLNSSGFAVQDSNDIPNQYGLSDFDAPHRFVLSAIYALPSGGPALTRGWQVAAIVQGQSGNPVNIVTSNSALNGLPNTVRPDLVGPIRITGSVDQWFDPSSFQAVNRFGNLARNVVRGPGFRTTDVSVMKNLDLWGSVRIQLRGDVFNLFNQVNLGPPGNIVGTPTFAKITRTRLPTGEAGSSRQIQFAARVTF